MNTVIQFEYDDDSKRNNESIAVYLFSFKNVKLYFLKTLLLVHVMTLNEVHFHALYNKVKYIKSY